VQDASCIALGVLASTHWRGYHQSFLIAVCASFAAWCAATLETVPEVKVRKVTERGRAVSRRALRTILRADRPLVQVRSDILDPVWYIIQGHWWMRAIVHDVLHTLSAAPTCNALVDHHLHPLRAFLMSST
jgi:hypothetical protein